MSHRERLRRLDELEKRILQQRIDMGMALRDWREATAPIDRGWDRLTQWRTMFYAAGGLAALRGVRKPRATGRLLRRALTGILLFNRGRRLYQLMRR